MARVATVGTEVEVAPFTTGGSGTQIDAQISSSPNTFVTVSGANIAISGSIVSNHTRYVLGIPVETHTLATITASHQDYVTIGDVPVCVTGDVASCDPAEGHTVKDSSHAFLNIET